jgi:hypothetical protein
MSVAGGCSCAGRQLSSYIEYLRRSESRVHVFRLQNCWINEKLTTGLGVSLELAFLFFCTRPVPQMTLYNTAFVLCCL